MSVPTLVLTARDVRAVLDMKDAVAAVESAFLAHGRGEAMMPPKVYLSLDEHAGDFRAMPSYMKGAAGVKWVNSHPENPKRHGLPSVMGLYILSDPATAAPVAILDGTVLTAARTGAAAAVASKHLAKKGAKTIGFVGTGVQSGFLLDAHRVLYPELEVLAFDVREDAARAFAERVGGRVASLAEVSGADIVCASTPSRVPVVLRKDVRAGAHLNAIGADAPGKQELEGSILADARVFIDDFEQATHSGEVNVPLHDGTYTKDRIEGTLGEVVARKKPGRKGDEITVFDSTGLAIQDLALARVLVDVAKKRGLGTSLEIVDA